MPDQELLSKAHEHQLVQITQREARRARRLALVLPLPALKREAQEADKRYRETVAWEILHLRGLA
jgi:hypothetical protein